MQIPSVERWNLHHRLQHAVLALSMIGLLATGLPIKYAYTDWAPGIFQALGGFHRTLIIHKVSAATLCALSLGHLVYLAWGWRKWGFSMEMMFNRDDLKAPLRHAAFLLGMRDRMPEAGRYNYLEKFEYLAIFWGMVVMGLSGFALWFPTFFAQALPRWMLDALRVIHSNEAFVALLSLAFGHFFFAHFTPSVFPSSPVWYSGRISLRHLVEEHPLEFRQLTERGVIPPESADELRRHAEHGGVRLAGWRRLLGALELLLYSAVFFALLVTFIPLLLR